MERKAKSTGIELRNIPILKETPKKESKEDIGKMVKCLARSVNVDLNDCDIKDVYRVTTSKEIIKPIIVELNSVMKKEKIIQAVKHFNKGKANSDKLSTKQLDVPGQTKPVFMSEALTSKTQKLFYMARLFARDHHYSYCWTSKGFIYLRKAEGEPAIRVDGEADLNKLKMKT